MLRSAAFKSLLFISLYCTAVAGQKPFKVIAFFTGKNDPAHISFVAEANRWFPEQAKKYHFQYDTTSNWQQLNADFLQSYQVVLFLDTRPEAPEQRAAFQDYMEKDGGFIGFHFSAFALTPSAYPQDWDWYHNRLLGTGQYLSNTWRPTAAILRKEGAGHPVLQNIPDTFRTAPNEWYRWEKDLRYNPDIRILLSIDSASFPLGTGPKAHEIWHSGYYPVVWTNSKYRMIYMNMGHNDMDYGGTNKALSSSFSSVVQNRLLLNALLWLGREER